MFPVMFVDSVGKGFESAKRIAASPIFVDPKSLFGMAYKLLGFFGNSSRQFRILKAWDVEYSLQMSIY
jgi:hypothetical protein